MCHWLVDLLGDILQNSQFLDQEIERERQVILQEIFDANDQPDDKVFDHFYEAAFGMTPMGWPILGTPETVSSFTSHHLKEYIGARYRAPHMVVVGTGCINHEKLVDQVRQHFQNISEQPALAPSPALYTGGERYLQRDLEQLHCLHGFQAPPLGHANYSAAALFATLFGGGMSSRLFQEVREKRGLAYSIYSFISAFKDCGLLGIYAGTSPEKYGELKKVLYGEIEKLAVSIPSEDIIRTKTQLKASLMMAWESVPTRAEQLANQILIYGRPLESQEIITRIDSVTDDMVLKYAQSLLLHPKTISLLGPINKIEA